MERQSLRAEEPEGKGWTIYNGPVIFGCSNVTGIESHSGDISGNFSRGGDCGGTDQHRKPDAPLKQAESATQTNQASNERTGGSGVTAEEDHQQAQHGLQVQNVKVRFQKDIDRRSVLSERAPNGANAPGFIECDVLSDMPASTKHSSPRQRGPDDSKLHVGRLPSTVTEVELRQLFEPYGRIQSVSLVHDEATGLSRGFGFVKLSSPAEAKEAIRRMHNNTVKGNRIAVSVRGGYGRSSPGKSIAVANQFSRLSSSPPVARLKRPPGQTAFTATSPLGSARRSNIGFQENPPLQGLPLAGASPPPWRRRPQARGADGPNHLPPPDSGYHLEAGPYDPYRAYDQAREHPPHFAASAPRDHFPPSYGAPPPPYFGGPLSAGNFHGSGQQPPSYSDAPDAYFSPPPRTYSAPPAGSFPQDMEIEGARGTNAASALLPGVDEYPDPIHQDVTIADNSLKFPAQSVSRRFDSLPHRRGLNSAAGYGANEPHGFLGKVQEHGASKAFASAHASLPRQSSAPAYLPPGAGSEAAFATGSQGSSRELRERLVGLQISAPAPRGFAAEGAHMSMHADARPQPSASELAAERASARDVARKLLLGEEFAESMVPAAPQHNTHYYSPMDTDIPTPQSRSHTDAGHLAGAQAFGPFSSAQGLASAPSQFSYAEASPQSERASSAYAHQASGKETLERPGLERTVRAARRLSAVSEGSVAQDPQPRVHASAMPPQSETGSTIGRENQRSDSITRSHASEWRSGSSSLLGKRAAREESEECSSSAAKRKIHHLEPGKRLAAEVPSKEAPQEGQGGQGEQPSGSGADRPREQRALEGGASNADNRLLLETRARDMHQQPTAEEGIEETQSEHADVSEAEDQENDEADSSEAGDKQQEQAYVVEAGDFQDKKPVVTEGDEEPTEDRVVSEGEKAQSLVNQANAEEEEMASTTINAQGPSAVIAGAAARPVAPRKRIWK